jgi:hypothetical protein
MNGLDVHFLMREMKLHQKSKRTPGRLFRFCVILRLRGLKPTVWQPFLPRCKHYRLAILDARGYHVTDSFDLPEETAEALMAKGVPRRG